MKSNPNVVESIKYLMTHTRPHRDEIYAIFLLMRYGKVMYPGIEHSEIIISENPEGYSFDKLISMGQIPIGVGGGLFDEHKKDGRLKNESSASLVAKHLGVEELLEVKTILKAVTGTDQNGSPSKYDLEYLTKDAYNYFDDLEVIKWVSKIIFYKTLQLEGGISHKEYREEAKKLLRTIANQIVIENPYTHPEGIVVSTPLEVITAYIDGQKKSDYEIVPLLSIILGFEDSQIDAENWAKMALEIVYKSQIAFINAIPEYTSKLEVLQAGEYEIGVIESDVPSLQRVMISPQGRDHAKIDVLIHRKSNGNTNVYTNNNSKIKLRDAVAIIRVEEQKKEKEFLEKNWGKLKKDGVTDGAEVWYFQEKANILFNGSLTHPDEHPTKLSRSEIASAVAIGINENTISQSCPKSHCIKSKCPFYDWGLSRCTEIRRNAQQNYTISAKIK